METSQEDENQGGEPDDKDPTAPGGTDNNDPLADPSKNKKHTSRLDEADFEDTILRLFFRIREGAQLEVLPYTIRTYFHDCILLISKWKPFRISPRNQTKRV